MKLIDKIDKWLDEEMEFNFGLFSLETNNFTLSLVLLLVLIINTSNILINNG